MSKPNLKAKNIKVLFEEWGKYSHNIFSISYLNSALFHFEVSWRVGRKDHEQTER